MFAVIGLGNPGARYAQTRHNMGFWAVDALASRLGVSGAWKEKGGCRYQRVPRGDDELILVEPQLYMNRSGEAALPLLSFYKIKPKSCVVVYDELDFDPGVVKIKRGGSAGGHNGVDDLITHLGSPDFVRIRIGIGHPRRAVPPLPIEVSDYVLGQPRGAETDALKKAAARAAEAVEVLFDEGLEKAQQKFNS